MTYGFGIRSRTGSASVSSAGARRPYPKIIAFEIRSVQRFYLLVPRSAGVTRNLPTMRPYFTRAILLNDPLSETWLKYRVTSAFGTEEKCETTMIKKVRRAICTDFLRGLEIRSILKNLIPVCYPRAHNAWRYLLKRLAIAFK